MASKQDEETCAICQCLYSDPRLIPCDHSFCKDCLKKLFSHGRGRCRRLQCPLCRKEHFFSENDIDKLPRNTELAYAVEESLIESQHCGQCESDALVVTFCYLCRELLCDFCEEAHRRMAIFKHHRLLPPNSVEAIKVIKQPKISCPDCTLYGRCADKYCKHHLHAVKIKSQLQAKYEKLKKIHSEFQSHAKTIAKADKQITTYSMEMKRAITSHFDSIEQQLQQRKTALLNEVHKKYDSIAETLHAERNKVATALQSSEEKIKLCEQLLTKRSKDTVKVAQMCSDANESMQEILSLSWNPSVINNAPLFYFSCDERNGHGLVRACKLGIKLEVTKSEKERTYDSRISATYNYTVNVNEVIMFDRNNYYSSNREDFRPIPDLLFPQQLNMTCKITHNPIYGKPVNIIYKVAKDHATQWQINFKVQESGHYYIAVKIQDDTGCFTEEKTEHLVVHDPSDFYD